jgi:8-oxo-dGTP diphosphatase
MMRNVALLILFNSEGKLLLQHRTADAPRFPNHWGFFGGGIEINETPVAAILREIREELEYSLDKPKLVLVINFKDKTYEGKRYIFLEKYRDGETLTLNEGQGMRWFSLAETGDLLINDYNRKVLSWLKEHDLSGCVRSGSVTSG